VRRLLKHRLVVGGVVLLAAAGVGGGAYAATQSDSNPRQALLDDVAKRLNVSPAQLQAAIQGAMLDRLAAAVKAGQLTQAQANRIKQRIEHGGFPFGPPGAEGFWRHGAEGFWRHGAEGFWRHGGGFRGPGRGGIGGPPGGIGPGHGPLSIAARYLGISEAKLLAELRGERTLAQVARADGKSVSGLEQALAAAAKATLDRMVAAGWLTQAHERERLTHVRSRIDQLVTQGRVAIRPPSGPAGNDPAGPPAPGPGPFGSPPGA
jgi:hypothetical protein